MHVFTGEYFIAEFITAEYFTADSAGLIMVQVLAIFLCLCALRQAKQTKQNSTVLETSKLEFLEPIFVNW
jgi:hypothetical protein